MNLPSIDEVYPHMVRSRHEDQATAVGLALVKWLEAQGIMNNVDFNLSLFEDPQRVVVRLKSKKAARRLKAHKKKIRDDAVSQAS